MSEKNINAKPKTEVKEPKEIKAIVNVPFLNIRKAASLDSEIVGILNMGQEVKSNSKEKNGFLPINMGDISGFVKTEFLTFE